jgi:hypothetical protein
MSGEDFLFQISLDLIQVVSDEMKRFDQLSQGYKKPETSPNANGEKNPGSLDIKSLDETKKHLGFEWNKPNK